MTPTVRPARASDLDAVLEMQHAVPAPELVGLAGSTDRASRLGRAITRADGIDDPARPVVVLERDGDPVGFLQYSVGPSAAGAITPRLVLGVARALGVAAVRLPRRLMARRTVRLVAPEDSLYLAELHVRPDCRGQGLGGLLLDWSRRRATELGVSSRSLITGTDNPARRLYERHGFEVASRATDARYERVFGQAGRVLMVAAP